MNWKQAFLVGVFTGIGTVVGSMAAGFAVGAINKSLAK